MLKNEKGFTLIEMLVVLLIITVLILLIVPNLGSKTGDMHDDGCDALIVTVQAQADMYELDKGSKVDSIGTLVSDGYINADRKSTRLNSSHVAISYAVFCLKKKRKRQATDRT